MKEAVGDFSASVEESSKILNMTGKVLPVTLDQIKICAELEDGTTKISYGEEDSRPMFVVYKGFITEMEVENEMKDIMKNREMYVNAKRLGEYLTEEC